MRRKVVIVLVAFAAAAALSAPAALAQTAGDSQQYGDDVYGGADPGAAQQPAADDSATLAKKAQTQTVLRASLTGEVEVPPGDPQASGSAEVKVSSGQVCWKVSWSSGLSPNASHIHKAAAGTAGPVVVPFFKSDQPVSGSSKSGCTEVSAELAKGIAANPANYYVNVHNADYPKGAIRGQLASAGSDVAGQLPNTGSFRSRGVLLLGLTIVAVGSLLLAVGQRRRRPSHARR
jgi:LPXTG-motif cell wall-anchored protein